MAEVSKLTVDNTTYDIKDPTARNTANNAIIQSISQSDFLTLNNGYTITQFDVNASDTMLFGHIAILATTPFGNSNANPFSIKAPYQPKNWFYSGCYMGNGEWSIDNIDYLYMATSNCTIVSRLGSYSCAILDFKYEI